MPRNQIQRMVFALLTVLVTVHGYVFYSLYVVNGNTLIQVKGMFDPRKNHPMIFETVIISCTVLIMCPAMSFLAALMYYPYYAGFHIFTLLANWIKLVCFNFPFAFFSQILLQYYDTIGLLKPCEYTEAGYRLYVTIHP